MHIRRSKSRDRTAVLKLARRFSSDIELHNLPLLADHIGTDRVIVACLEDDKPKGFVYAYIKGRGSSPYSPGRDHLYVAAICVDQDNRKKGIASALMKELVKSNSHRKICGQVFCSNAAAKKLYTKNGFNELCVVFSKEAFKEADKSVKTASIRPFEVVSMAGGIKCPYCGSEGFDKGEFESHLKYCAEYLKIKDTPLARPLMKNSGADSQNLKCPFCGEEGFDLEGLKAHLSRGQCEGYNKVSELPPPMFSSIKAGTDEVKVFYIVTKPSTGDTLKTTLFEVKTEDLPKYFEDFQNGEVEGIFSDKFVAETVAKSLLEAVGDDSMEKEGSNKTAKFDNTFRDINGNILVKEGDKIEWPTMDGSKHSGIIHEMDSNVAYIDCENCQKVCCIEL